MHPSVCALRRIHLPLQGRLWGDRHPEGSPGRGAGGVSRLRGAVPCPANTLPGRRKAPGGRERPPYNVIANGRQARQVDGSRGVSPLCVGADACIGPPAGLAEGWRLCVAAHSRPQCRAGVFARRLGFAASQGFRDDASIVPYGCGRQGPARLCRIFPPPTGNAPLRLRLAAHPPPLAGEAL